MMLLPPAGLQAIVCTVGSQTLPTNRHHSNSVQLAWPDFSYQLPRTPVGPQPAGLSEVGPPLQRVPIYRKIATAVGILAGGGISKVIPL